MTPKVQDNVGVDGSSEAAGGLKGGGEECVQFQKCNLAGKKNAKDVIQYCTYVSIFNLPHQFQSVEIQTPVSPQTHQWNRIEILGVEIVTASVLCLKCRSVSSSRIGFVNEVARLPDGCIDVSTWRAQRLSVVLPLHPLTSIKPCSSQGKLMLHL